jgi:nitrile hydratase accessory protein
MTVDDLREVLDAETTPTEDGDPVFDAAWQARIFGLSVSMRGEDGVFKWESFQRRLAEEIATDEQSTATDGQSTAIAEQSTAPDLEADYYRRWLAAFERLLLEEGHLDREQLEQRAAEFADGDRTAAEFVEGDHEGEHGHHHHEH